MKLILLRIKIETENILEGIQKMKKTKGKSAKKIRGNTRCFENTKFEQEAKRLRKSELYEDDLTLLRNYAKDAFALRMKKAAIDANAYEKISKKTMLIINNYLIQQKSRPYTAHFVACFFDAYNGEPLYLTEIGEPKCKTKIKHKAFTHGKVDCEKGFDEYIKPINQRLVKEGLTRLCTEETVGKYQDINFSLKFAIYYICDLYCNTLPLVVSDSVYNTCYLQYDENISKYYKKVNNTEYILKDKKVKFSKLNQECATYLICYKHFK